MTPSGIEPVIFWLVEQCLNHLWYIVGPLIKHMLWKTTTTPHYGPGVDSATNRIKYKEYFLGVKVACA
jgi:hypothetical protein